jgi:sporulation protein YlmC with PRC-barrel domain
MDAIDKDRMLDFRGEDVADEAGDKIGKVVEMYLDADSGEPEWALVHTGLFGSKQTFVPLRGATEEDGGLRVPLKKQQVSDAPHMEPSGQLTKDQESELYRHYGVERADRHPEPAEDDAGD